MKDLSYDSPGQSYFNLKWTKPDGLYSGFKIIYAKPGQSPGTPVDVGDVHNRNINNLEAGTRYTVTVYTLRGPDTSSGLSTYITTGELFMLDHM